MRFVKALKIALADAGIFKTIMGLLKSELPYQQFFIGKKG